MEISEQTLRKILEIPFPDKLLQDELLNCRLAELPEGQYLLRKEEYVKMVPLVLKGGVKVIREDESGKEILLYSIQTGESCALSISACFAMGKSKAIAITESSTTAILITAEQVREWMSKYPTWRQFVLQLYNQRFNEILDAFDDLAFRHVDERLIEKLREKKALLNSSLISITHQELADELGTAREVVSRLLKHLERQGKIKVLRGKIEILSVL
jgi:CRP/FNR family transcriptional regulator, anaerobic regulatory protein